MTEREIERTSPPELADLPADFWAGSRVVVPPPKQAISLRVDRDVLAWFKRQGPRYQTRMNAVLRSYVSGRLKVSRVPAAQRKREVDMSEMLSGPCARGVSPRAGT